MGAPDDSLLLVYSCSGCSSAAQTANQIALQLDRQGVAEMSCIAGVGGDVPHLVKIAKSGRTIVALDGCALACSKHCLARHGVNPQHYYQLQQHGVKKRYHADVDNTQVDALTEKIAAEIGTPPSGNLDASEHGQQVACNALTRNAK